MKKNVNNKIIIIVHNNTAPSGHMRWELRLTDAEATR